MKNSGFFSSDYQRRVLAATPWYVDKAKLKDVYDLASEFRHAGFDVEVDHIVPIRGERVCGLNVPWNMRVCMKRKNRAKQNKEDLNMLLEQQAPAHYGMTVSEADCTRELIEQTSILDGHSTHYAKSQSIDNTNALAYSQSMLVRDRRQAEAKREIEELVADIGITRAQDLLNVHRTTIKRWIDGKTRIPEAALLTLRGAVKGQLPNQTDKHWEGWGFGRDGYLHSPEGYKFHSGDLLGIRYQRQLIRVLEQEIQQLKAKLDHAQNIIDSLTPQAANDRKVV